MYVCTTALINGVNYMRIQNIEGKKHIYSILLKFYRITIALLYDVISSILRLTRIYISCLYVLSI